jgi:long-chain fatty acid transport protein
MDFRRLFVFSPLALLLTAGHLGAQSFTLFQHGGRAMGQAGALTARADEPSALTYNPAAIARLEGYQMQAGIDFNSAKDRYESASGSFERTNDIQIPPSFYATWKRKDQPWAFGLGLDQPMSYNENWRPVFFPGRFLTRRFALRLFELHPVVAYDLGDGWSIGGGPRYLKGTLNQGANRLVTVATPAVTGGPFVPVQVEIQRDASADVDTLSWDLAIHYNAPAWGWGAVLRDQANLKGSGDATFRPRDVPVGFPDLERQLAVQFASGRARQSFELPRELRSGIWYAPYPELRLELDASYQMWSSLDETAITFDPNPVGDGDTVRLVRDWKDTLSLRLAAEGNLTDQVLVYGGIAREPSPVPLSRLEPGFPRRDATVYAVGASYSFPWISFDLGYSYHDGGSIGASGQEPQNPGRTGTYKSTNQVWGFSVRWRL